MQTVSFLRTTKLTGTAELLRRSLDPAAQHRLAVTLARGRPLQDQPLHPADERFQLYVPARMPSAGYALLVFISPADDASIPPDWIGVLDTYGIICVTPEHAGNDANVIGRREPLALLAAQDIPTQYRTNPARIWITGFSGGGRVAMRLALGYPDIFTAAILNAGSDPIGPGGIPLPPDDLLAKFRTQTRLIYVTGEWDSFHQDADTTSQQSMAAYHVQHIATLPMPQTGHALMDAHTLSRAIRLLIAPAITSR